jgi:hypothetical protein
MSIIKTVMTRREEPGIDRERVRARTIEGEPDVTVVTMPPWQMVGVRALRVYLQSVLGFITAGGVGLDAGVLPNEFGALFFTAVQLALAPAVFSALTNTTELLTKLDISNPELRA